MLVNPKSFSFSRVIYVIFFLNFLLTGVAQAEWYNAVKPLMETQGELNEGKTSNKFLVPANYRDGTSKFGSRKKYLNAIVLYVTFAGSEPKQTQYATQSHIFGDGAISGATDVGKSDKLDQFIYSQSLHKLRLNVTHETEYRSMPHDAEHYRNAYRESYKTHKSFVQDAINQFDDVNFDNFDFVIVVPAHSGGALRGASNVTSNAGQGVVQDHNKSTIRRYITLGDSIYSAKKPYRTVAHELGHLFGFPDLYPYRHGWGNGGTDADYSVAGSWGIMSDDVRAHRYLEWHRFKAGWVSSSHTAYVHSGEYEFKLESNGIRMVVIPVDDVTNPTTAYVIQRTPVIDSADYKDTHGGAGILVFKVFSDRKSGADPIELKLPAAWSGRHSAAFGNRYQAVFHTGHTFDNEHGVSVEVLDETPRADVRGQTARIKVTVNRTVMHDELRKRATVPETRINGQIWSGRNLDIATSNSVCFENKPENCSVYGRFYSYDAAQDACKALGEGWELPTDKDWLTLSNPLGGAYGTASRDEGRAAYTALAAGGSTNFDAQLGGKLYFFNDTKKAYFYDIDTIGYFWTSSIKNNGDVISYTVRKPDERFLRETITRQSKISVRCIQRPNTPSRHQFGDTSIE